MSNLWPKFTKENPCPACSHGDWSCRAGDKKFICMRVESPHPSADGGFYHEYGGDRGVVRPLPMRKVAEKAEIKRSWDVLNKEFQYLCGEGFLANDIGVSVDSLISLGCGWGGGYSSYTFAMRDGDNNIIGIQLRGESKKCITGSRLGLFIPQIEPQKICFVCEGASDCAALLTMGFFAIGRASCTHGADMLKIALKRLSIYQVVIVSDNDDLKSHGKRPGIEGAKKLKKELGLKSVIYMPPHGIKDVRELLQKLGAKVTRQTILDSIDQKTWSKI